MRCEDCRAALPAYIKGELDDTMLPLVEDHLAQCGECAREAAGARRIFTLTEDASGEPITKMVNTIIGKGFTEKASDIHIRAHPEDVCVYYRIDGVLREAMRVPKYVLPPLATRIRMMCELDVTDMTSPQDGRFVQSVGDDEKKLDFRVSIVPAALGPSIVIRILDASATCIGLGELGMQPPTLDQLRGLVRRPCGLIVVSGPTGCGKSTTLYSVLHETNSPEHHTITIEDPVEYLIEGTTQIHVNRKAGLTFAPAVRSILRQDPDIIMIGEIRDRETAELAFQAALTGHLVLTTLHANDAAGAVWRFIEIGVERFVAAQGLLAAVSQRLLRKVCAECKQEVEPTEQERRALARWLPDEPVDRLWRGQGCENCRKTGYRGRVGISEILELTLDKRELIQDVPDRQTWSERAREGMRTMHHDAALKVREGITTVEEAVRVLEGLSVPEPGE